LSVWENALVRKLLQFSVLCLAMLALAACTMLPAQMRGEAAPSVIAFGSCANQNREQPIWDAVVASHPDLFVFLGDNIYGDTTDMTMLRAKYAQLAAKPGYQRLVQTTPVIATWDDHDYGTNDAGAGYPMKNQSKQIFLDFFAEPANSERRLRDGGIYTSYLYGPPHQRVQVILLDTRWDRSPINRVNKTEQAERDKVYAGPYIATTGPNAQMLGEDQWRWLEAQLRQPAVIRLIGTSTPFLQDGTGWETWANFPDERERLISFITQARASGAIFITGDTHRAQFSRRTQGVPYPLWEVDSSGLTENWKWVAPDKNRFGGYYVEDNYGLIRIDWTKADPEITMEMRAVDNDLVLQNTIRLSELQVKDE
jgi:alkaline phosphatase D